MVVGDLHCKGRSGEGGDGGAVTAGDADDVEVGGGAAGDGKLEQRFESAGGGAKERPMKGEIAKSQNRPLNGLHRQPGTGSVWDQAAQNMLHH